MEAMDSTKANWMVGALGINSKLLKSSSSALASYLSDREQAVIVGPTVSSWQMINIGTPQGSVLGPFMFIILINFILL